VEGEQLDEDANRIRRKRQKHRSHRLNILERFLFNRVGLPWSRVYAEACSVADSRSFQGAELRAYLKTFVAVDCWLDKKKLMSYDWRGCPKPVQGLYVHPKSRLLLRNDI
jgi:hypothetical protein